MRRRIPQAIVSGLAVVGLTFAFGRGPCAQVRAQETLEDTNTAAAEQAYSQGNYRRTISLATTVLQSHPDNHVALYLRGSARVEIGIRKRDPALIRKGVADARGAITLAGTENPLYYFPYLYGMTHLAQLEDRPEHAQVAVQTANDVLKELENLTAGQQARIHYQRGLSMNALGRTEKAVADFEQAIELDPTLLSAYTAAASTLTAADKAPQARAMFDKAVEKFPNNPLIYNNRGDFLQKHHEIDAAIADYTRAVKIDPSYFYAVTNRGYALLQQGKAEAAETDFTKSLEINPQQPMVYGLRGKAHLAQGEFQEAIADSQKAVAAVPRSPVAITDLGFAQFFAGKYEQAAASFAKAYELNPSYRTLQPWRVAALAELKKKEAAAGQFQESLNKPAAKRDWVDRLLAFEYGKINAAQLLQGVSQQEPMRTAQNAEAYYFIGRRQLAKGQADAARQSFQKVVQSGANLLSAYRGATLALKQM